MDTALNHPRSISNHPGPLAAGILADQLATRHADKIARRDELLAGVARFHAATAAGITDVDTQARATDFVKQIKSTAKIADGIRETEKRPYLDAGRTVGGFFKGKIVDPLTKAAGEIELKMTAFARAQAEASRQAAAEAARLAAEEAERKSAELLFDAASVEDVTIAEQTAAEAAKLAAANSATHSRVHGDMGAVSSLRTRWVHRVVSLADVPRQYLMLDERAVNAAISAGLRQIPGIEIYQEEKVVVR